MSGQTGSQHFLYLNAQLLRVEELCRCIDFTDEKLKEK